MLAKRIIPCLDVKDGKVVKGIQFKNHRIVGDIESLAQRYRDEGADELVFYDITASCSDRVVDTAWVTRVAKLIDIPFCVAGGIRTLEKASAILHAGADKISINSPALENPDLINQMVARFGSQCVVIGIDSRFDGDDYYVYQYTGMEDKIQASQRRTQDWAIEVCERGCGEIVLNCMNRDGEKNGFDVTQLSTIKKQVSVPVIASGGAGCAEHFQQVFTESNVDGALAASIFHSGTLNIADLKRYLAEQAIEVRR